MSKKKKRWFNKYLSKAYSQISTDKMMPGIPGSVVVLDDGTKKVTTQNGSVYLIDKHGFTHLPGRDTGYVLPAPCHSGNNLAFTSPDRSLTFFGGGWTRGLSRQMSTTAITLDLADVYEAPFSVSGFAPPELIKLTESSGMRIAIRWNDYSIPALDRDFWDCLLQTLKNEATQRKQQIDVHVCCMGGHGRTGTALAIIAGIYKLASDPVKFVRDKYCNKSVESETQIDYIKKITGLEFTSDETKPYMGITTVHYPQQNVYKPQANGFGYTLAEGEQEKKAYWWDETKCVVCLGRAVDGLCMECHKEEMDCNCPR